VQHFNTSSVNDYMLRKYEEMNGNRIESSPDKRKSIVCREMSSVFSKYPSLLFEILFNNVYHNLQSD